MACSPSLLFETVSFIVMLSADGAADGVVVFDESDVLSVVDSFEVVDSLESFAFVSVSDMAVVVASLVFEEPPHPASESTSPMVIEMVVIIFLNSFAFIQSPPFGRACFLFYLIMFET